MSLQDKLQGYIEAHNELHNNIQAGEQQLAAMKTERERLVGKIQAVEELLQEEQTPASPEPETIDVQPVSTPVDEDIDEPEEESEEG